VQLRVYKSIEDAFDALFSRLAQAAREVWLARRHAATEALNARLQEIKDFFTQHLDVSEVRVGVFEKPTSVSRIELSPIEEKSVSPPLPEFPERAEEHKIEFTVNLTFQATVIRYREPPPEGPLKIGEQRPTVILPYLLGGPPTPQAVEVEVPGMVDAQATADFSNGVYTNLQMNKATVRLR